MDLRKHSTLVVTLVALAMGPLSQAASAATRDYFLAGPGGDVTLRGSGFRCPARLASLERDELQVLDERPAMLDLSCHYSAEDVTITVFVTRMPGADFQEELRMVAQTLRNQTGKASPISPPVALLGPGRFDAGQCWNSGDINSCITLRRMGEFVVQLRVNYGADGMAAARNGVRALEARAFQRGTVGH